MGISDIKKDLRQRIKLQGRNFDRIFPKKIIAELFDTLNAPNSQVEDFELRLLFLTHSYLDIKIIKKERASAVKTAEKFREIASSIHQTRQLLKLMTNPEQILFLKMLNGINSRVVIQPRFRDKFSQGNSIRFPRETGEVSPFKNIDVASFFSGLQWMEICAKRLVNSGEKPLPGGALMKLGRKDSNDHIHTLVEQIRTYWIEVQGRPFSRDFLHGEGAALTSASRFCEAVAKRLDATITPTQINSAMKKVISSANKSKVAGK